MLAKPRRTHEPPVRWNSYLVLLSLWTDPKYIIHRLSRWMFRLFRFGMAQSADTGSDDLSGVRSRTSATPGSHRGADLDSPDVDLVYMWVRGQDPLHRKKRNYWLSKYGLNPVVANPDVRYVEEDELRYSLRTVELFVPWVRRVFIVTDDQIPEWLDTSNPKVRIVDHTEIVANPDWLPTFNSSAIAAQLHNVPGLAEHFIICNDDTFFGQPCVVEDFFAPSPTGSENDAVMRVMLSDSPDDWIIPMHHVRTDPLARLWMASWNNVKVALELRRPWRKVRYMDVHQVVPMTRSALRSVSQEFSKQYRRTCSNKFRRPDNLRFTALARYRALDRKAAVRGLLPHKVFRSQDDLSSYTRSSLPTLFCVNGVSGAPMVGNTSMLERLFPEPSSFEVAGRKLSHVVIV